MKKQGSLPESDENSFLSVNFHCHSIFSDGDQTPEALAVNFARAGVRFASLTDHDSLEGSPRFAEAARKNGVTTIPGLELTTWHEDHEIHLLAYGFDPEHSELTTVLHNLRQNQALEVHSIASSLRKKGTSKPDHKGEQHANVTRDHNRLSTLEAIKIIHRAGGKVFLAHPLATIPDAERLNDYINQFSQTGLDGLEVFYEPFSAGQRAELSALAARYNLLTSAGTDLHANNGVLSIKFPKQEWQMFRNAMMSTRSSKAGFEGTPVNPGLEKSIDSSAAHKKATYQTRVFVIRILLPTMIAMGLFIGAIWGFLLPSFEQTLLDKKRELIQELTNSAWSILVSYEQDVQKGEFGLAEAQRLALDRIEAIRYGPEGKDYFWVQDLTPMMLMHPYRPDLNGQDVSSFKDARGVPIFVEFANLVRREEQGYINYVWQWKDDPARLEPKQSYVKGFKPWGWVIGTGIYTDDVNLEIARIERSLVNTSLIISGAVILLLFFVLAQSMKIDRERQGVVNSLRESTEKYHSLVEATTEGTLLVMDGRYQYANPIFLKMTGYSSRQMEFLDLEDLVPKIPKNLDFWKRFDDLARLDPKPSRENPEMAGLDGVLRGASGDLINCVFMLNEVEFAGQKGLILLAKKIHLGETSLDQDFLAGTAQTVPVAIFRARNSGNFKIISMNDKAREFFSSEDPCLEDLFVVREKFEELNDKIMKGELIRDLVFQSIDKVGSSQYFSLSADLSDPANGDFSTLEGTLQDVTSGVIRDQEKERLLNEFQSYQLFLHQPIALLQKKIMDVDDQQTAASTLVNLKSTGVSEALVTRNGQIVGFVTRRSLDEVLSVSGNVADIQVSSVMRSIEEKVPDSIQVYEALAVLAQKNLEYLAVINAQEQVVNVLGFRDLARIQDYSPVSLLEDISHSDNSQSVAKNAQRVPPMAISLLKNSSKPGMVTHLISSVSDAVTNRLLQLAIQDLGPAPTPFVFVAMGSQGRMEQTLLTDQDNGIIYLPGRGADEQTTREYFNQLGRKVCDDLATAGYAYCQGGVMANQVHWCRTLNEWVEGFKKSVNAPEPQEIINLNIFLDFRPVYGDISITDNLKSQVNSIVQADPTVLLFLAKAAINFKSPARASGGGLFGAVAFEHGEEINLKDAMMPIVTFARLYALRDRLIMTHTGDRIQALSERGIISSSSRGDILSAYQFLLQTRLEVQRNAIQIQQPVTNTIKMNQLGYLQRELLKQSLIQIEMIQKKINYEFMGGMG